MFNIEQILRKMYFDPKHGYRDADDLYEKAHERHPKITRRDVSEFLKEQEVYQLHKEVHRKKEYLRTFVGHLAEQIQIDLIDMRKYGRYNEGYNWIIAMIDIFSRYAFTIAVKSKSGKDVLNGFVKLMGQFKTRFGKYPKKVQADEGKEFLNTNFSEYLKHNNIEFFATKSVKKAAIVERFNRTLKNIMWKFMDQKGEKNWHDYLSQFTYNYNHSKHSTIKMRPTDVNGKNEKEVFEDLYGELAEKKVEPPKFKVGDKVRVSRYKSTFAKGYEMTFHNEIYTIYKVFRGSPTVYKLIDESDGETIFGRFYKWELQRVKDPSRAQLAVENPPLPKSPTKGPMDNYVLRGPAALLNKRT